MKGVQEVALLVAFPPPLTAMDRLATMDKVLAAVVAGSVVIWLVGRKISKRTCLPPGPRPLPLIGNAHQVPRRSPWLTYAAWAKEYGMPTFNALRPKCLTAFQATSSTSKLLVAM